MKRALRKEISTLALAGAAALALGKKRQAALGLSLAAAAFSLWPSSRKSLRDSVVVITGGSRGLGLALAEAFLAKGAWVALLARDLPELRRAQRGLDDRFYGRTVTARCDVTQPESLARALRKVRRILGGVDIFINNAGIIAVAPLAALDRSDFERTLELSLYTTLESVGQLRPYFQERGGGHLVNICSLGGKVSVPHMTSYCAAKFALAGLSGALGPELAPEKIKVTTVFPGVMRVGSTGHAKIKGNREKEYTWFTATSLLPGISLSAEAAAARIVAAVQQEDAEVIFPASAQVANFFHGNFPEISAVVRTALNKAMPVGASVAARSGFSSRAKIQDQWWFRPVRAWTDRLERRWNQVAPGAQGVA